MTFADSHTTVNGKQANEEDFQRKCLNTKNDKEKDIWKSNKDVSQERGKGFLLKSENKQPQ